jgi:hypothetical protein
VNALSLLSAAFELLKIPYLIGGSLASSARGIPRSTVDVDILARLDPVHAEKLAAALGAEWYADAGQIRDSLSAGCAFNLIHRPSLQKFDIFPATDEFHASELQRATTVALKFSSEELVCPAATAEDILLAKLKWYRAGGEVSERQWTDIAGLLSANAALDFGYLRTWAARLRVDDLLARALAASRES